MHHATCISASSCGRGRGDPAFAEGKNPTFSLLLGLLGRPMVFQTRFRGS